MALENQEMILQTFNILHKSSLCAKLFTNKLTLLSCKPDRKRQTVKFSERQGTLKFPTVLGGKREDGEPWNPCFRVETSFWSYESSKDWRCWGKHQETWGFYIWVMGICEQSFSLPMLLISGELVLFFFSPTLRRDMDDNSDFVQGSYFQSVCGKELHGQM